MSDELSVFIAEKIAEYRVLSAPLDRAVSEIEYSQRLLRARIEAEISERVPALRVLSEILDVSSLDLLLAPDRGAFVREAMQSSDLTSEDVMQQMRSLGPRPAAKNLEVWASSHDRERRTVMPAHASFSIILGLIAGLGNLVGGILITRSRRLGTTGPNRDQTGLHAMMQIGAGFLLAVTLLETMPATFSLLHPARWAGPAILGGYLLIHFVEHTVAPHFHFGEEEHVRHVNPVTVYSAVFGLAVHAFFDGVAIGAASRVSVSLGALLFIAILLHKIPEGATVSSLSLAAGLDHKKSLWCAAALGLATIVGVGAVLALKMGTVGIALGVAAGVSLYVSATDLIPHGNAEEGIKIPAMVFVGAGIFAATDALLRLAGLS